MGQVRRTCPTSRRGAIVDDGVDLHADQVLVGRAGPNRHAAAHGNLHHAAYGQRRLPAADVGRQLTVERHLRNRGAIDHLDPQVVDAVVAADNVETDVGQHAVEGVGIFLELVFRPAGHAAPVHRGAAPAASLGPIADFDHLGHLRHRGVGPGHDLQVGAAGNFLHAALKSFDLQPGAARPKLVRQRQRATRPHAELVAEHGGKESHAEREQSAGHQLQPQRLRVEDSPQIDVRHVGRGLATRPGEHLRVDL